MTKNRYAWTGVLVVQQGYELEEILMLDGLGDILFCPVKATTLLTYHIDAYHAATP